MAVDETVEESSSVTKSSNRNSSDGKKVIPVRVAVRVRPLVEREKEFYSSSLEVAANHPQVNWIVGLHFFVTIVYFFFLLS